jgi:hypothetical protein
MALNDHDTNAHKLRSKTKSRIRENVKYEFNECTVVACLHVNLSKIWRDAICCNIKYCIYYYVEFSFQENNQLIVVYKI